MRTVPQASTTFRSPGTGESRSTPEHLLLLAEVGQALTAGAAPRDGITRALAALAARIGAARSALYVADTEQKTLEVEATHGFGREELRPRFGLGVAGRVADSGRAIVVPVVRHEPMAISELTDPLGMSDGAWGLVCVPIQLANKRVGALATYFREGTSVDKQSQLSVLSVVASLFAQALCTAHLTYETENIAALEEARQRAQSSQFEYANMIGASVAMRQVYEQIGQVARTNATALICGESGTGKELVAHAIHKNSPRAPEPFVKVNCAALPETLFESELFGHERGAFTGAHARRKGRFELAQGGTLFLDEIGELSLTTQAKLLRVLQFREFERLGGSSTLRTDVRIVAATNKDMESAVAAGAFREDLYYRLNVFTIRLPPLRERRADIAPLAEYFLQKFAAEHRRRIGRISSGALDLLCQHTFPGNVRELENVMERAVVICDGFVIQEHHLPLSTRPRSASAPELNEELTLAEAVARLEKQMIQAALERARGNASRAARALGTTERIVRYKAGKYGILPSRVRG